jgi:hypothetical protein
MTVTDGCAIRSRNVERAETTTSAARTSVATSSSSREYLSRCEIARSTRSSSSTATRAYPALTGDDGSSPIWATRMRAAVTGLRISCAIDAESCSSDRACFPSISRRSRETSAYASKCLVTELALSCARSSGQERVADVVMLPLFAIAVPGRRGAKQGNCGRTTGDCRAGLGLHCSRQTAPAPAPAAAAPAGLPVDPGRASGRG